MAYQCESYDKTTLSCLKWVEAIDLNDLAITGAQASLIITAIASYYLVMWLLNKSRYSIK